ncbi:hypothetical protein EV360DRAFT_76681, partial [Lentinula raphanica]
MSARLRPTTILPVLRMLVSMQTDLLVQIHRLMFSAPSSTKDQPQDVENLPTSKSDWRKSSRQRSKNHPSNLAPSLTPLFNLHFALSDGSHGTNTHMGYNHIDRWNFFVDFFEDPQNEEEEKHAKELLKWWN